MRPYLSSTLFVVIKSEERSCIEKEVHLLSSGLPGAEVVVFKCKYNKHYSVLTLYVKEYCYPLIWLKYDWSVIE